ncbi:MAG TPA: hypothetical protein VLH80_07395 [Nitrospiraceae bacterium]|nr:hypothetical protein [Nitrospiraceae bacterium]
MKAKHVGLTVPPDEEDASLPGAAVRPAQQRIAGDEVADEIIAASVKRAEKAKARAQTVRREKITPKAKQTHAVDNDNVHTANESDRQADSRTEVDRDSEVPTSWRLPSLLDAPPPRPGMCNRWVRLKAGSEEDVEHFEAMLEEGWRPVKRSRVRRAHELTASTHGKYDQYYVKRGLILMEMPEKLQIQRDRYFKQQQKDMNRGVDRNLFKINHRVMPLLQPERSTRVTTTARRGRLDDAIPGDEAEA